MYNRYIPQADGSYQRSRVPDNSPTPPRKSPRSEQPQQEQHAPVDKETECYDEPIKQRQAPCQNCQRGNRRNAPPPKQEKRPEHQDVSVGNFLRQLLPKDFDTGDLLVVILLLLMSGDSSEDQNFALLTLALYLFM